MHLRGARKVTIKRMKTNYQVSKPTYNISKSWDYNYDHGPFFDGEYPPLPKNKNWTFLGHKLISPLGIAAGPLPNAKWLTLYAKLGYGTLIQKTVRSTAHKPHPAPNIMIVDVTGKLDLAMDKPIVGHLKVDKPPEKLSITNSFGNPCREPKVWTRETKKTESVIKKGQLFGVSVYGTSHQNTILSELAQDYAKTALMAKGAGAMFIEANLACPNVSGAEDPFLYKDAHAVSTIAKAIKSKIGKMPLILKIGYFESSKGLYNVIKKTGKNFEAISAINTIPKKIVDEKGRQALPGRNVSGVCGFAIKEFGIKMVRDLVKIRKSQNLSYEIIGVGGAMTPEDVVYYLKAGANHVHSATAVIWNPYLAYELDLYFEKKKINLPKSSAKL